VTWLVTGVPLDRAVKRTATVTVYAPVAQQVTLRALPVPGGTPSTVTWTVAAQAARTWLLRGTVAQTVVALCQAWCAVTVTVWDGNLPLLAVPAARCQ
jgi:hypothetical protein